MNKVASAISSKIASITEPRNITDLRVTLVGIGNPMRGDDGFGPKIIEELTGKVRATLFDCGTAPENYIFPILQSNPDIIILLDTVDFSQPAGSIGVFSIDEVSRTTLSTHHISARIISDLLKIGSETIAIFMVGIQPKTITFGTNVSQEVQRAIAELKEVLVGLFGQLNQSA